jgi:hypothetical protein
MHDRKVIPNGPWIGSSLPQGRFVTKRLKLVALPDLTPENSKTTPLYLGINMARKQ